MFPVVDVALFTLNALPTSVQRTLLSTRRSRCTSNYIAMLTLNHRSPRAPDAVAEQPQNNWLFTVDFSGYLISPVWLRCTTSMHALTSTRLHIFIHIHIVINCCPPPVVQILGLIHFYLWLSKHSPLIPLPQYRSEELIDWMIIPPPPIIHLFCNRLW